MQERITAPHGDVLVPWTKTRCATGSGSCARPSVEAIAVCLLHAYLNPDARAAHRQIVARGIPGGLPLLSSEVVPLYREFERFSTTALNAYVGPKVSRYLASISAEVKVLMGYKPRCC